VSSGSALFIIYARYGCIQVSSIIMTSSGSAMLVCPAPETVAWCWPCSSIVSFVALYWSLYCYPPKDSLCTGKHWDPMFARLSASSLLALLTCETSHPSNIPSR
jgi:hypothetical protein